MTSSFSAANAERSTTISPSAAACSACALRTTGAPPKTSIRRTEGSPTANRLT